MATPMASGPMSAEQLKIVDVHTFPTTSKYLPQTLRPHAPVIALRLAFGLACIEICTNCTFPIIRLVMAVVMDIAFAL
jgi:hypothetical protein